MTSIGTSIAASASDRDFDRFGFNRFGFNNFGLGGFGLGGWGWPWVGRLGSLKLLVERLVLGLPGRLERQLVVSQS